MPLSSEGKARAELGRRESWRLPDHAKLERSRGERPRGARAGARTPPRRPLKSDSDCESERSLRPVSLTDLASSRSCCRNSVAKAFSKCNELRRASDSSASSFVLRASKFGTKQTRLFLEVNF